MILTFPLDWIYKTVQQQMGNDPASIALTISVVVVLILGVRGGVHAHQINRILREEAASRAKSESGDGEKPVVLEVFGMELLQYEHPMPEPKTKSEISDQEIQQLVSYPRKHRGKQPRFPVEKIRKAVLQWERRDPSFSVQTLEEFLEQEFGCGPDGILLMASSTFYDWRRHVLKEIQAQQKNH
ncbi:MAG: hypothetical protein WBW94_16750 [Anaerolineales bacterium]